MGEESQESNLKYLKEKIRGIQSCFTYFRACQREKRNYMTQKYAIQYQWFEAAGRRATGHRSMCCPWGTWGSREAAQGGKWPNCHLQETSLRCSGAKAGSLTLLPSKSVTCPKQKIFLRKEPPSLLPLGPDAFHDWILYSVGNTIPDVGMTTPVTASSRSRMQNAKSLRRTPETNILC